MNAWTAALLVAIAAAALEWWMSGPKPFHFLASLKQPRWGLPIWAWIAVGAAFYAVMTLALAVALGRQQWIAASLIIAVMITDGFWNYLLFRRRRLDWAFWYLFPYTALVAATTVAIYAIDNGTGTLIAVYLAFLPYDIAWTRALLLLNPNLSGSSSS